MPQIRVEIFREKDLTKLKKPAADSAKNDNGQITVIGGSILFHGAPLLAIKAASRTVDMVYFSSPEPSMEKVAAGLKSRLASFIWVPWNEVEEYIKKSEAVLIGPGFMRYRSESQREACERRGECGEEAERTKRITENLLKKFPGNQWIIDAGSLQTLNPDSLPKGAILTPNKKELAILFRLKGRDLENLKAGRQTEIAKIISREARNRRCIIVLKGPTTIVGSEMRLAAIGGGNPGLTKGGTGDVLAGLTAGLAAKNEPFLAACAASFIVKKAADILYRQIGFSYNADDLAEKIPEVLGQYWR